MERRISACRGLIRRIPLIAAGTACSLNAPTPTIGDLITQDEAVVKARGWNSVAEFELAIRDLVGPWNALLLALYMR